MKQLITYFGLAYLISWTIWLPLYGHIFGWTHLPTLPFNHAIGGFGPLISSFLTTWIFLKTKGVNKLITKCFQFKPLNIFSNRIVQSFHSCFYRGTNILLR